ncbi:MAG: serine hydrolase [Bacteroidia bacterium]
MKKNLLISIIAFIMQNQCTAQTFDTLWANRFQTVLDSVVAANNIKGASAAVLYPGQGIWTGVSGISSAGVPVTADMRFGIGSNTKLFIATVMAKLQEQGVLSLDDHLYQWLPAYPYIDSTTTIRQLLNHQSGIFDFLNDNPSMWSDSIWADTSRFWTPQEILATIGPPHFAPGHGYSYSNTNYLLAGMIIDTATGISWVQNLHNIIFNPLNMDSTFVGAFEAPNGPVAHEWVNNTTELINSPMTAEYSQAAGAGALLSTAGEMVQWYSALFSGAIIADSSLQEVIDFEPTSFYGLGVAVGDYNLLHLNYNHTGGMLGYISLMWYDVQTKSVLCILTNGGVTDLNLVIVPIINVLYNDYPKQQNDAGIISIVSPWENGCSATVTPSVSLTNFGSDTLTNVTINYSIDGGVPAVFNWTGTLGTGNQVAVTLSPISATNGSHIFACYTSSPNGGTEGYTYNDSSKSNFIVNTTAAAFAPLTENFDGAVFPPAGYALNSNSIIQWGQTSLAQFNGTSSAVKNNYFDGFIGAQYDLDLPMINITGIANAALGFEYAYTNYPGYYDSLRILISSDCGVSWQSLFYKGGNGLKTAPTATDVFYPTSSQWKHETISLAAYTGEVLIRFRNICGYGNNLYIDDVHIDQSTGIGTIAISKAGISVYPNPAQNELNVQFAGMNGNSSLKIIDITGRIVMEKTAAITLNQYSEILDISNLQNGMYQLTITTADNKTITTKVIKQ